MSLILPKEDSLAEVKAPGRTTSFSPELDRIKQRRDSFDLKFEPTFSPRDSKNYNMKQKMRANIYNL